MNNAATAQAAAVVVTNLFWNTMNSRPELTSDQCAEYAVSVTAEMLNVDRAALHQAFLVASES